jgi:sugar/nucleoside kinase (ribokinase family)
MDVVGFGENSIDHVFRLPQLPSAGAGKLRVDAHTTLPGGQVATTMAACAAMGLRAGYIGALGNDDGAARVRAALTERGVDLRHAIERYAPNRYAVILVDAKHGERVVLWDRDPRLIVTAADVRPEWIAGARLVHVDAVDEEASIALASTARKAGIPVTSDIETITPRTEALLGVVTVPIFAESVPSQLTGESDPARALRALRQRHEGLLVVTRGAAGSMLLAGDTLHTAPAPAVSVIDTTGAGDVFRAGFIYAMLAGLPPDEMLRFANAAAAISCTRAGAMTSVPTLNEVARLLGDPATELPSNPATS